MRENNILILNPDSKEKDILTALCRKSGSVFCAKNPEEAKTHFESTPFHVVVVNYSLASYSPLKELIQDTTSILITGADEQEMKDVANTWPINIYVDFHITPLSLRDQEGFLRALSSAVERSSLKFQVEHLTLSAKRNELKLKEAYTDIREIKNIINESILKELEKRISIEAKYIWFKKEKQKIESILKKLHTSSDVTQLLDIVYDIKEILKAEGISLYILEENKPLGKILKPLVLDDSVLSFPDFSKQAIPTDAKDFAASVARRGLSTNLSEPFPDSVFSERYRVGLKSPLKNILSVPILHKDEAIGVLEVYNKAPSIESQKGFTNEDQKIMERFAEHICIAINKLNLIQYDALTGLLRPEPFFNNIIQKLHLERKRRGENTSFAMVMGDVDWFKNYNDRNGHQAGNILLRELAAVLKSSIREEDLLCRYGGEEFLFFFSGIKNIHEASVFTERIRKDVEEHHFDFQEYQPTKNLTMSFGLTYFTRERIDAWESTTKLELIKIANEADMALAAAKGKESSVPGMPEDREVRMTKNKVCLYKTEESEKPEKTDLIDKYMKKIIWERRRHKRFPASTILLYKIRDHHQSAKTINLSMGGAKIASDSPLDLNQSVDLILILGNKVCQLKGNIVYSSMMEEDHSRFFAGIEFKDVSYRDRIILQDYFSSLHPGENSLPN